MYTLPFLDPTLCGYIGCVVVVVVKQMRRIYRWKGFEVNIGFHTNCNVTYSTCVLDCIILVLFEYQNCVIARI